VVQVDAANDLALLKAVGRFAPLPIAASRTVKLGGTVATVGFPDIGLQGFAPKLAKGKSRRCPAWRMTRDISNQCAGAAGQFGRRAGGRARQRGGHRRGQTGCVGGAGSHRGVAGECELCGEEQFALELP